MTIEHTGSLSEWLRKTISKLKSHLAELGYSESTILRLDATWKELIVYCEAYQATEFTVDLERRFVWERYSADLGDRDISQNVSRAIHMLDDYLQYGMVFKQSSITLKGFSPAYKELFEGFLDSLRQNQVAEGSIRTWRSRLFRFEYFLLESGIEHFHLLELHHVNTYIESLTGFSPGTVAATIRILGKLFDYALAKGYHYISYANALPCIRRTHKYRLPTVFSPDEVECILAQVDRSNPLGKRNYAILLLVTRLGLRISDVRLLRFENIDWKNKRISIHQQKTGIPLELPLLEDVGWAIIDYLQHGRPETDCPCIFVRHLAPFDVMSGSMQRLVSKLVSKAGVHVSTDKPIGMHSFRHSVATSMLNNGAELTDIAQTLGHATPESTQVYVSLNTEMLRRCALEVLL